MEHATNEDADSISIGPHISALGPYMKKLRKSDMNKEGIFSSCLKASLAKAYDFCFFAENKMEEESAFYSMGVLRSICEDIIILKFISCLEPKDQDLLIRGTMHTSLLVAVKQQKAFFDVFRPGQLIIDLDVQTPNAEKSLDDQLKSLWVRNGWPRHKDGKMPPTAQIAHKIGPGTVDIIYEYIFRFTSQTVHFNPRSLLVTGWEMKGDKKRVVTFSPSNYGKYFIAYCRIYGALLLTIYMEFFEKELPLPVRAINTMKKLRVAITMQPRWPEMVTFEEMNQRTPKGRGIMGLVQQFMLTEEIKDGFINAVERRKESNGL